MPSYFFEVIDAVLSAALEIQAFNYGDITRARCLSRFCKRRVPFPTFGGWVIILRRNPAGLKFFYGGDWRDLSKISTIILKIFRFFV